MTPGASPGLIPSPLTRGLGCLGSGQFCSWHYFSLGDFTFVGIYDLVDPRSFSQSLDSWILLSATCFYLGSHLGLGFLCQSFTCKGRDGKISWEEVAKGAGEALWKGKEPSKDSRAPLGALESKSHCKHAPTGGRVSGLAHSCTHSQAWSHPTRCPFPGTAAS